MHFSSENVKLHGSPAGLFIPPDDGAFLALPNLNVYMIDTEETTVLSYIGQKQQCFITPREWKQALSVFSEDNAPAKRVRTVL